MKAKACSNVFRLCLADFPVMAEGKGGRPVCIGLHGSEMGCDECGWEEECRRMSDSIESAATRKGTHVRLTGKYSEKKYKPRGLR